MYSIEHILDALRLHSIKSTPVSHMSYSLEHNYTKEEFELLVPHILSFLEVKPQSDKWYPGTPTGNQDDWGFYICPQQPDVWDEGDFDMAIHFDSIYWC